MNDPAQAGGGGSRITSRPPAGRRLYSRPCGAGPLDAPVRGGQGRGVKVWGCHCPGDCAPCAENNARKPWQPKRWCVPEVSAAFVAAMEEVLDLDDAPSAPQRPTVHFEEMHKPLIAETRGPLPARALGSLHATPMHTSGKGHATLCRVCEPQAGWRHGVVTVQRAKHAFAHQMQWLVAARYPQTEVIRVVLDTLNPHTMALLYEAFAPEAARCMAKRRELHDTPKPGSWLNMAEMELSMVSRQG
jgi:hypothetical protein